MISDERLQKLTEDLSLQFFDRPFLHRAYINKRLRTTGGRYLLHSHHIEVNGKYFEVYGEKEMIGILKHELCHYHLHLLGKGYKHKDADFKELLKQTGSPRYCRPLPAAPGGQVKRRVLLYRCTVCGRTYERRRRVNVKKYACGICRGTISEVVE